MPRLAVAVCLLALSISLPLRGADTPPAPAPSLAPEFPDGLEWLNTDKPLKLAGLRGKFVLLDFWTYCCINCIHVIPDLHRLEAKYPNELVVIGVHSAKFATEQGTDNIREAILRYDLHHPVVNDKDMKVWDAYGASGWPAFVLIDPAGHIAWRKGGEGIFDRVDPVLAREVPRWKDKLDLKPRTFALEKDKAPRSLLAFPGKIAADAAGQRLAISDSNHHRVVIVSLPEAKVLEVIGAGAPGLEDGGYDKARFNKPQGVAFSNDVLYVADTENHAVRAIDLAKKTVRTLAGNGKQATRNNVAGAGADVALNSPWDVLPRGQTLYVAMAGAHQVWTLDTATGEARPRAGSGREDLADGPLANAALAQTSGLATDGQRLYLADSETSSVRAADLAGADPQVKTLVGKGLFAFDDKDGDLDSARLQHPLGVLWHPGEKALYVADTYNNKVKRIDPARGTCETVAGTGKAGMTDGPAAQAQFNEPNGLALAGDRLYVADTNNHLVRVLDLKTRTVSTLRIAEPQKLVQSDPEDPAAFQGEVVKAPAQQVAPGDGAIEIALTLPQGYHLNDAAPTYVAVRADDPKVARPQWGERGGPGKNVPGATFPLKVPVTFAPGQTTLTTDLVIYYCETGKEGLCLVKRLRIQTPVEVHPGAPKDLRVDAVVR